VSVTSGRDLFPKVRIVDTPGTRCLSQEKLQKKSIETQIKKHTNSATAVLVLANGTVPGVTVGTRHILSTLLTVFHKAPTNVAFVLTNVSGPLCVNFSTDILKHAPRFLLNNPVALQRKYLELKDDPTMKKGRMNPRDAVLAEELEALGMLVELFDWVDSLPQQQTVPPKKVKHPTVFALIAGGRVLSALAIGCESDARIQPQSGTELVRSWWEGSEVPKGTLLRRAEGVMQEAVSRVRQVAVGG